METRSSRELPDRSVSGLEGSVGRPSGVISVPPFFLAEKYESVQFLGEGGMGTVYRARDPRLDRLVALKLLKGTDSEMWGRFLEEARAQAQIEHENVCRVYDTGEMYGQPYIAMQYIDGVSLSDLAARLSLEQAVRILQRIASAVHEAHRLGIIHRDIKPGNILVEVQESGAYKPFILDFGLARRVGERGQTQTGVVLGTLTHMPPEQARGDWRALDRRSDVFALGATLYDAIAGQPPFFEEQAWKLLMRVTTEDAPRLSAVKAGVPRELETIVMKCLERDPSRRYDSAKALADDLQKFLDGSPIQARPISLGRSIWRKVRKHPVAAALLAAALSGSVVLGGVWAHGQRQAAERARLAHELGGSVKEMELLLRLAYEMPLHDVERERDLVRSRLRSLELSLAALGDPARGPLESALGQGYLALGDLERAREHLEKSFAAGERSADLECALGRTLGELFQRALEDTLRISNEDERKKKVAELERELRDPALAHLRAAVGSHVEAPAYAEGLIALYEGNIEVAVAKASEALQKAPWMYEAKKLEGDALFTEGSKYRHDAAFDHDKMRAYFDPAARAYSVAAEIGRSDPSVHLAECVLWEKMGWADYSKVLPSEEHFAAAQAACARAAAASSREGRALVQQALVLDARAFSERTVTGATLEIAEQARDAAEKAVDARPSDVMARYSLALSLFLGTRILNDLGGEASMDAAVEAYKDVLAIDPGFTWAVNELGEAYAFEARKEDGEGGDGAAWEGLALRQFDTAIALDPKFALPVGGELDLLSERIGHHTEKGEDAQPALRALDAAVADLEKASFGRWLTVFWQARAGRLRAADDLARGRDPRASVTAALQIMKAFAGDSPDDFWLLEEMARCHLVEARYALAAGLDARPSISAAREKVHRAGELGTWTTSLRRLSADIDLVFARTAGAPGAAR